MAKVKMGKWDYTAPELEAMHRAATKRGAERLKKEPQASAAVYDRETNRLVIELKNGATLIIPVNLVQGLRSADPDLIAEVELLPRGAALHWETLDQDYSIAGLLAGVFGTKSWMAEMGRKGGRATTDAKSVAARENGLKGGRPRTKRMA